MNNRHLRNHYRGLAVTAIAAIALTLTACNSEVDQLVDEGHSEAYAEGHVDGCRSGKTGFIKRHDSRYRTDGEYKTAWDNAYAGCAGESKAPVTEQPAAPVADAATGDAQPGAEAMDGAAAKPEAQH